MSANDKLPEPFYEMEIYLSILPQHREMRGYNPLNIPFQGVDEREGSLLFVLTPSDNFFDRNIEVIIFDVQVSQSVYTLRRRKGMILEFEHWNTETGIRIASVDVSDYSGKNLQLTIGLSWSKKETLLHISDIDISSPKTAIAVQKGGKVMVDANGEFWQIGGDQNTKLEPFFIDEDGKEILSSNAKEIWDHTVTKVEAIIAAIDICKKNPDSGKLSPLIEGTLTQQGLVVLVTGFEVYTKGRIMELEKSGVVPNSDALLKEFAYKKEILEDVKKYASLESKTILESLIAKRLIDFQNWEECNRAYFKGYGISLGELGVKSTIVIKIKQCILWRHKIIHSKRLMIFLNEDKLDKEAPIIANKDTLTQIKNDFTQFIDRLHAVTLEKKE